MSSLSTVEASLPPGFRFHPRDEELICDYLMKWVMMGSCGGQAQQTAAPFLIEVDLNKVEPWDIPETACVGGKDWYFYSQRDRKYATGIRTNRATISGYWKATGKDRPIFRKGTLTLVGMRKTLVFYQGRAPKGRKTDWVMHEFRLEGTLGPAGPKIIPSSTVKEDWVLCRVFYKKNISTTTQSEVGTAAKQEIITCSSPSDLPELVEPNNYMINSNSTLNYHQRPINQLDRHRHHHQNIYDHQYQQQQVPCFSILTDHPYNQTNPTNFSRIRSSSNINHHHHHHPSPNCNNIGSGNHLLPQDDQLGNVINSYPAASSDHHADHKNHVIIKAVLNQYLTKMENINPAVNYNDYINNLPAAAGRAADDGKIILKDSSISFGDAGISTSDSYLSEVGLSSIWNNNFS